MPNLSDLSCAQVRFAHNLLEKADIPKGANLGEAINALAAKHGKKACLEAASHYSMHMHFEKYDGNIAEYALTAREINLQPSAPVTGPNIKGGGR